MKDTEGDSVWKPLSVQRFYDSIPAPTPEQLDKARKVLQDNGAADLLEMVGLA